MKNQDWTGCVRITSSPENRGGVSTLLSAFQRARGLPDEAIHLEEEESLVLDCNGAVTAKDIEGFLIQGGFRIASENSGGQYSNGGTMSADDDSDRPVMGFQAQCLDLRVERA